MVRFLARRLGLGIGILLVLSLLMYFMLDLAMDPLDDLRTSTAPNKEAAIEARILALQLDQPWHQRYRQHRYINRQSYAVKQRQADKIEDRRIGVNQQ